MAVREEFSIEIKSNLDKVADQVSRLTLVVTALSQKFAENAEVAKKNADTLAASQVRAAEGFRKSTQRAEESESALKKLGKALLAILKFQFKLGLVVLTAAGALKAFGVNTSFITTRLRRMGGVFKGVNKILVANTELIGKYRGISQGLITGLTGLTRAFGGNSAAAAFLTRELSGVQLTLSGFGRVLDETIDPVQRTGDVYVNVSNNVTRVVRNMKDLAREIAKGGVVVEDRTGLEKGFGEALDDGTVASGAAREASEELTKATAKESFTARLGAAAWGLKTAAIGLFLITSGKVIKDIGRLIQAIGIGLFRSAVNAALAFSKLTKAEVVLTVGLEAFNEATGGAGIALNQLREFIKDSSTEFRQSRIELEGVSGRLLEFAGTMDISSEKVEKLIRFTAALATATGKELNEAFTEVQSVILNSSNALADFGVNVTEAVLVEEGFIDTTKKAVTEFTSKEKAIARVNAILDRATFAEAIATKTAKTFAGELQGLRNAFKDLSAEAGKGAEAALTPFARILGQITRLVAGIPGPIATIIGGIQALVGPLIIAIGFIVLLIGKIVLLRGAMVLVKGAAQALAILFPTLTAAMIGMDAAAIKTATSMQILGSAMRTSAAATATAITGTFTRTNILFAFKQLVRFVLFLTKGFAKLAIAAAPLIILAAVAAAAFKVVKRFADLSGATERLTGVWERFKQLLNSFLGDTLGEIESFGDVVDAVIASVIMGFLALSLAIAKTKRFFNQAINSMFAALADFEAGALSLTLFLKEKLIAVIDQVLIIVLKAQRVWEEAKQVLEEDVTGAITRNILELNKQIAAIENATGSQEEHTRETRNQIAALKEQAKFLRMIPPAFDDEVKSLEAAIAEILNRVDAGESLREAQEAVLGLQRDSIEAGREEVDVDKALNAELSLRQQLLIGEAEGLTSKIVLRNRLIEITNDLLSAQKQLLAGEINSQEFTERAVDLKREELTLREKEAQIHDLLVEGLTKVAVAREGDLSASDREAQANQRFGGALEEILEKLPELTQELILAAEGEDQFTVATNRLEEVMRAIDAGAEVNIDSLRELIATYGDLSTATKQATDEAAQAWKESVDTINGIVRQLGGTIEDVFVKALQGQFRTMKEFLKAFGDAIVAELTKIIVRLIIQKLIIEAIETALGGASGGGGGATASTEIPALQHGGIVRKPTLGIIGEAGPEAVIPLDRLNEFGGSQEVVIINAVGNPEDFIAQGIARNPDVILNPVLRSGRLNGATRTFVRDAARDASR